MAAPTRRWTLPDAHHVWHHHGTPSGRVTHNREPLMSARKLSRLVGFLFVLAAMLGVVGTASAAVVEHTTGTAVESGVGVGEAFRLLDSTWT